jgi:hypothetical protein
LLLLLLLVLIVGRFTEPLDDAELLLGALNALILSASLPVVTGDLALLAALAAAACSNLLAILAADIRER